MAYINLYYIVYFSLHIVMATSSFTRTKLALRLIHRHSISPPPVHIEDDDIRAPLIPMADESIFLVNVSIGEPPLPQLLAMDTGSELIWVHCTRCTGWCSNTNIFDPKTSSTYTKLTPASPLCPSYGNLGNQDECLFEVRYGDKSTSNGVLALEKFTFQTSTGGTVGLRNVLFGCALKTGGGVNDLNGILGLEDTNQYYVNKFSYCIGSISDTRYAYNHLILGDGAILEGASTPMQTRNGHYAVSIEGISVGEKRLMINREDLHYNVLIDSGTTFSKLVKSAYEPLAKEVGRLMDGVLKPAVVKDGDGLLCYSGDMEKDLKGFPLVTLHLAGGTDIDLDVEGFFQRTTDRSTFCMAVLQSTFSEDNIIGVIAQQYYNVGFDLEAKRVSFQRIDCELLED